MEVKRRFKAALFDLDGVIFDTEGQYSKFWRSECQRYFPTQEGLESTIKGQTLTQIYVTIFASLPEEQPHITERLDAFERQMEYRFVEGFNDFVRQMQANGVKTAVVTSSNQEKMNCIYARYPHFKDQFDAILTAEDMTRSKPFPDCYQEASRRLEVETAACVVFEDSLNGLKAGRDAGMFVVGLTTTNAPETVRPLAHYVASDFRELSFELIERQLRHRQEG